MRILPLFGHVHGVAGAPSCRAEMRRNVPPHLYFVASDDHFLYAVDLRNREMLRIPRDGLPMATNTVAQGMFQ